MVSFLLLDVWCFCELRVASVVAFFYKKRVLFRLSGAGENRRHTQQGMVSVTLQNRRSSVFTFFIIKKKPQTKISLFKKIRVWITTKTLSNGIFQRAIQRGEKKNVINQHKWKKKHVALHSWTAQLWINKIHKGRGESDCETLSKENAWWPSGDIRPSFVRKSEVGRLSWRCTERVAIRSQTHCWPHDCDFLCTVSWKDGQSSDLDFFGRSSDAYP